MQYKQRTLSLVSFYNTLNLKLLYCKIILQDYTFFHLPLLFLEFCCLFTLCLDLNNKSKEVLCINLEKQITYVKMSNNIFILYKYFIKFYF